jgi:hypothetical protein
MTIDIGDIIIDRLSTLPWLDKYTGVVKTISYQSKNKDSGTIIKRMPAYCRTSAADCSSGRYIDLCPDSRSKSVLFLEDNGVRFVKRDGNRYFWRASYNLVVWLNLPALGYEGQSYSGIAINGILSKFPPTPFQNVGSIYQQVNINLDGQLGSNSNPFAKYSFPEEITQYLMYPYEALSLPITVDFMTNKACLDIPYVPAPNDCVNLRPSLFKVTIKDQNGNILQEFTSTATYYVEVLSQVQQTLSTPAVTIIQTLT